MINPNADNEPSNQTNTEATQPEAPTQPPKKPLDMSHIVSELQLAANRLNGRGRDAGCPAPPAQIRTCGIPAYGSYPG